jgi:hypothetical protein
MENFEFQIKKIGTLNYSRLESLSILRREINSYGYNYTISEVKLLLDSILNNTFEERFNLKFKMCFDKIFNGNKYTEYDNNPYKFEKNFSDDFIAPVG